jgi:hypothetical protein
MPDLINIDTIQKAADINVPILRQPKFMALLLAYLSPTRKLQDDIFNNYLGSLSYTYSTWVAGNAYNVGDRVTAGRSSYECIQANTDATVTITNTTYWYKVSDDIIGLSERLNYNCQTMQLEYILNKRFNNIPGGTVPPYSHAAGNIYIETNPSLPRIAWIGRNNAISSYIKRNNSTNFYYHTKGTPNIGKNNYTINVPTTVLSNLSSDPTDAEQIIITETNKYNSVGLTFDVAPY